MNENKIIRRLSAVGILGNICLVAFKFYAGIAGHSGAMVSDAVHSLSDVFATFVAFIGTCISRRPADREHPYGHDRIECFAALILGSLLIVTGLGIGWNGVKTILSGTAASLAVPGRIALIAALVSIAVKEGMFWYTRHYAKKLNSSAFMADAWHHRSDAFSSIGSLIGIGGARLGFPIMEPLACLVICLCILKVGYDILKDAVENMLDASCGADFDRKVRDLICAQSGVKGLDLLQSRKFGSRIYIDAEISVDGSLSLNEAHEIAQQAHDAVEEHFPNVSHIMIHENPHQ